MFFFGCPWLGLAGALLDFEEFWFGLENARTSVNTLATIDNVLIFL
jgi:hypothetical protein